MKPYDHKKIEKKWQKTWDETQVYKTLDAKKAIAKKIKPYYVLDMFPYPSGAGLHVGHPRGYIASDVFARVKRMHGYNVLHPMGFDSFGLPAEQYAIQTGKNPGPFTDSLVKRYKQQLSMLGFSYDWNRQIETHNPEYYKWTQWIFLQIYNSWFDITKQKARPIDELIAIFEKTGNRKINTAISNDTVIFSAKEWNSFSELEQQEILMNYRLAYEGYAEVNWCEELGTVLANDEVVQGPHGPVSERGDFPVIKKKMRQWFMRITAYGDRLIKGLEKLDWSHGIKEVQRNWIGKSEGAEIDFSIKDNDKKITVFTTRADTLFGVTYIVLAPEHELIQVLKSQIKNWNQVQGYINEAGKKEDIARTAHDKNKTGIQIEGIYAINPANNEQAPIWIADYVLANYGTGAVMAVPAHDERDKEFANVYQLPVIDRPLVDKIEITKKVNGKIVTKYKLRDAIFARQRYWGEPIPLVHEKDGVIKTVKEKDLPLELPKVKSYTPSGNGEGPLATVKSWVSAGYETNTMPGWAGSSWYFLRYIDSLNKKSFASDVELDYWFGKNGGVDMYVGGQEHATGHLLYSRFWHKVLFDLGYVKTDEPFKTLRNQGMILAEDGRKMSKRWGNVINPDDVVDQFGADTMRVYEMFMGPFEASQPWSTDSMVGARRFIERIWRFQEKIVTTKIKSEEYKNFEKVLHKTIKKITDDVQEFSFNTAVSAMMIFANEAEKHAEIYIEDFKKFIQILAPFAPYVADEIWNAIGEKNSIHISDWPKYNPKLIIEDIITIGVQINGKVRAEIAIQKDISESDLKQKTLLLPEIIKWIDGKDIKKFIYIPGRVINIVI